MRTLQVTIASRILLNIRGMLDNTQYYEASRTAEGPVAFGDQTELSALNFSDQGTSHLNSQL